VRSTQKITSAMKMVSASKLRRAQNTIIQFRPYAKKLSEVLYNVFPSQNEETKNPLEEIREAENIVFVVITSNKGLCGGFNNAIIKQSELLLSTTYAQQHKENKVQFVCIGKRGSDYISKKRYPILEIDNQILDDCTFEKSAVIADKLIDAFIAKKIDKVEVIYSKFKSAGNQTVETTQYLPVVFEQATTDKQEIDYIFEPQKEIIYQQMVPQLIKMNLYQYISESIASEHGARMVAMHQATENADELIKDLRLSYNKMRQASITNALIEMVSAAESLKS
ncbi:MAG: ATP synthase F1 subunit gamma, partial [Bacteroidales bacterium]|nr:ATP synthase F1 subunit gamma [Bacteroidales bacterium]